MSVSVYVYGKKHSMYKFSTISGFTCPWGGSWNVSPLDNRGLLYTLLTKLILTENHMRLVLLSPFYRRGNEGSREVQGLLESHISLQIKAA